MKTCDNCAFKFTHTSKWCGHKQDKPEQYTCNYFKYICEEEDCCLHADYKIEGQKLCSEHALEKLGINVEEIKEYFTDDWEYLGDDKVNEEYEIIEQACENKGLEYKLL